MFKFHTVTGSTLYIQGEDIEYLIEVDEPKGILDAYLVIGTRSGVRLKVYAKLEHVLNANDYEIKEVPNAHDIHKSLS